MAKVTPITEQFQHFVSELKESFWSDLQGQVQQSMGRLFELLSERQRDLYMGSPRHSRKQLVLTATVVSEASKNRVWDSIKSVDPSFADLKHNIQVVAGQQVYIVQSGDNLSKISEYFYGNANKYMDIAKANGLSDPDKIRAGQQLTIP